MKNLFEKKLGTFLCFFGMLGIAVPAWAASYESIQKSKILRVATEGTFAPFNFFKGKELTGFEVDLVNEIAKKLSLNLCYLKY